MVTVHNTITLPDGRPETDAVVTIRLVASARDDNAPGYVPTTDATIVGTRTLRTSASGYWSADLVPNSLIEPAGTYYEVIEHAGGVASKSLIVVAPSGVAVHLYDLLTATPA